MKLTDPLIPHKAREVYDAFGGVYFKFVSHVFKVIEHMDSKYFISHFH